MKVYKLTNDKNQTRNSTQWGKNVTHEARGDSKKLCNDSWIHAYPDPILALLMNPIHVYFEKPHLWECEAVIGLSQADKIGCTKLTTIKKIRKPKITTKQKRKFAILCALEVYNSWKKYDLDSHWYKWALSWLNGETSRSTDYLATESARSAYSAAYSARSAAESARSAYSAARSAYLAAYSAYLAAESAYSAAESAARLAAQSAAYSAASAAYSAAVSAQSDAYSAHSAYSAAYSAYSAAESAADIDLVKIAHKVMEEIK